MGRTHKQIKILNKQAEQSLEKFNSIVNDIAKGIENVTNIEYIPQSFFHGARVVIHYDEAVN